MRKLILTAGLVILLIGGFLAYRASRPALTPEEQVTLQLEDIARSARARQVRAVMDHLTSDFKYGTMTRDELRTNLQGAFFQYRSGLDVQVSGVKVEVHGDEATTDGHYTITGQTDPAVAGQTFTGDFKLNWRQEDGQWKVYKGEGSQPPGM